MSLGQSLQKYTYQYLLTQALSMIPDTVDKREGSIIYDALAPACYLLAEYFMEAHRLAQEISIETASGEWLDNKVLEVGIARNQATAAVKIASFTTINANGQEVPAIVPIGSRFATISDSQPLYYVITGVYVDEETGTVVPGSYLATCETVGTVGNSYTGTIVPLDFIPDLASAVLGVYDTPGADEETDENLRERYLSKVRYRAFGGNIAQYREMALGITGIGGVQVHPTWNGGGTVKLSIVDSSFLNVTEPFLGAVQNTIDPDLTPGDNDPNRGSGVGLGLAPIDHRVTVVTPEQYVVDITASVDLNGRTIDQVRSEIVSAIEAYFAQLRADWDNADAMNVYNTTVYQSQVVRAALSVEGVSDFSEVVLKKAGTTQTFINIVLTQNGDTQQLPILGEVTLNVKS